MTEKFFNKLRVYWDAWINGKAQGAQAKFWLIAVSFTESSFFLIPPDLFLIAILVTGTKRWFYYSNITAIASVLGGAFGYLIGFWFFDSFGQAVIEAYNLEHSVAIIATWYEDNAMWSIFFAGFVPVIPYKVFSISAGLFGINFWIFLGMSAISRWLRFLVVGYVMKLYGEKISRKILEYFNIVSVAFILIVLGSILVYFL